MAHDVFISHAHKDIEIAKAICRKLELARITCWIAQRDIVAGDDWTVATRKAIASSRVLLVLLSENANAATHIEREMAQAFYSKLPILPVRLNEAPLKRDFLFYLSDVRCFEASKRPEEEYLEPLTASVKSMVQNSASVSNVLPRRAPPLQSNLTGFSDSWLGALQASHYRTLDIVKKLSITIVVLSVGWVCWYLYSAAKSDGLPADDGQRAARPVSVPSPDSAPQAVVEASPKPEYTYSRFGLWIASKNAATPAAQESGPTARSTPIVRDSSVSESPPNVERQASAETANSITDESADARSAQKKTSATADRAGPAAPAIDSSPTEKDELAQTDASTTATPSPEASPQPVVESTPAAESTPVAEASLSADSQPVLQSTPAAESIPLPKATPSPDAGPLVKSTSTPAEKSTPLAEATPSAGTRQLVESMPATESTPVAEASPSAEARPLVESTPAANSAPSADARPWGGSTPAGQSTPPAEAAAAVKSGEEEAEVGDAFKPSLEEQSLKELVLDYLKTVAGDDETAQERLFGWRVNFYGKGVLAISGVRASMDRYRQEWPVRDWEPEGDPEFPGDLHSIHPELYEVLQPFSWRIANGSRHKTGRATLYVRIRRDEKGSLHIIHLELRQPGENSTR
jgi:hypothetical protein